MLITRETIAIDPAKPLVIDAVVLEQTMRALTTPIGISFAPQLASALALYRGDFLDEFHVEGAPRFTEWLMVKREQLRSLALDGYQRLTAYYEGCGEHEEGIRVASAMLRLDPTNEIGHSQLMRMLAFTGRRAAALAQFEICRQALQAEFGVEPGETVQKLYTQIRDGLLDKPFVNNAPVASPSFSATPVQPLYNLPAQLTPLLGRQAALATIQALLQRTDVRLVTLTGPGGVGKSRLGEAVAWALLAEFTDGVFLVELAAIRDPQLVISAIAQILDVREQGNTPLQQCLHDYLQGKQLLLLLDNFEQVIDAAPQVQELLRTSPQLKILVTSRETLRLYGEHEFSVQTLSATDAVALFVQRAQALQPNFALESTTAEVVATICQQLDYLPLAIELAAAQSKLFSPVAMLARLQDRFSFLIGRTRDRPDRQRTLLAALDWSYELLTVEEQRLFCRLAVFVGGRSLDAVATICNPKGDELIEVLAIDELTGLTALLEQSLLYQTSDSRGEPRFMMLLTIHEYALSQLERSGEAAALHRRHLDYYLALAEHAETQLNGEHQVDWLIRLELELDNIRAALTYALQVAAIAEGARLCAALRRFWGMRGYVSEAREWFTTLLAQPQAIPPQIRAQALSAAGTLAEAQSDYGQAVALQQEALALHRAHGNETGVAVALNNLGFLAENQGDYARARDFYEETLALSRTIRYELYIAISLINLGRLLHGVGTYEAARVYAGEGLARNRAMGNQWGIALSLDTLGNLALSHGDYVAAYSNYEEAFAIREDFGGKWGMAIALRNLGEVNRRLGKYAIAQTQYEEGLRLISEINDPAGSASLLSSLGRLNYDRADYGGAQQLLQQSLTIYQSIGDKAGIATTISGLGRVHEAKEDNATASALYDESLTMQRTLGRTLGIAVALHDRARLAHKEGDGVLSRTQHKESLLLLCELIDPYWIEQALRTSAQFYLSDVDPVAAAHLFGAATAIRRSIGVVIPRRDSAVYEQALTAVRTGLSREIFASAWAAGQAMNMAQAVDYALAQLGLRSGRSSAYVF